MEIQKLAYDEEIKKLPFRLLPVQSTKASITYTSFCSGAPYVCCCPENVFCRDVPAIFSNTISNHILPELQQHAFVLRNVGMRRASLWSRPVSHKKLQSAKNNKEHLGL